MPVVFPSSRTWAVPVRGELVPLDMAEALLLLSAASGLAGALCRANDFDTALHVARTYLQLKTAEALMPVSALNQIESPKRSLPCVCLTDAIRISVEKDSLSIPLTLIHTISTEGRRGWRDYRASIRLIDGSTYSRARLGTKSINVLSLVGPQTIDLKPPRVTVRGRTVAELLAFRQGLALALERHHKAVIQKIGEAAFGQYFRVAA